VRTVFRNVQHLQSQVAIARTCTRPPRAEALIDPVLNVIDDYLWEVLSTRFSGPVFKHCVWPVLLIPVFNLVVVQ